MAELAASVAAAAGFGHPESPSSPVGVDPDEAAGGQALPLARPRHLHRVGWWLAGVLALVIVVATLTLAVVLLQRGWAPAALGPELAARLSTWARLKAAPDRAGMLEAAPDRAAMRSPSAAAPPAAAPSATAPSAGESPGLQEAALTGRRGLRPQAAFGADSAVAQLPAAAPSAEPIRSDGGEHAGQTAEASGEARAAGGSPEPGATTPGALPGLPSATSGPTAPARVVPEGRPPSRTSIASSTPAPRWPTANGAGRVAAERCRGTSGLALAQCRQCAGMGVIERGFCQQHVRLAYCAGRYGLLADCPLPALVTPN